MACSAHRIHRPRAWTAEEHHVVPRAWQAFWGPDGPAPAIGPGLLLAAQPLWDPRTVTLCPTGHRNVHHWLVALMKATPASEDPLDAKLAVFGRRRLTSEQASAYLTLCRWREAGGSLVDLRTARLYGEA